MAQKCRWGKRRHAINAIPVDKSLSIHNRIRGAKGSRQESPRCQLRGFSDMRRCSADASAFVGTNSVTPTSRDNELAQRLAFPETSSLSPQILESKKVLAEFSAALRDLKAPIRASRWKWRLTWSPPSGTTNKGSIPRLNRRSAAASTAGRSLSMAG